MLDRTSLGATPEEREAEAGLLAAVARILREADEADRAARPVLRVVGREERNS